jgi:5-methylcytosine-specific restriction protein A
MKDCIYQTDPEWAGFLRRNAIKQEVNFWRKDTRVMGLEPGAYFYFKKRGSSSMIGRGRLVRSELRTVEQAWNAYQKGNGAPSLEHLKPQIASVLNIDLNRTLDAEIRCMILKDLEWLADEDVYELSEEQFPKNILAMKYFDRGEDFHVMEGLFDSKNQQSPDEEIEKSAVARALGVEVKRNPPWSRDELIIALEFYLRHTPSIPAQGSVEVSDLSDFLNRLGQKLGGRTSPTYRNSNGVYLKMMNLRRFDPDYSGRGMQRGNKVEQEVWNRYASKPKELLRIVEGIRSLVESENPLPFPVLSSEDEVEAEEGQVFTRMHQYRERDKKLVKRKKDSVFKDTGCLRCEACAFDFSLRYGEHGTGFIECHHTKPVSELKRGERTKLSDLSLVCSNCHRMIHHSRPWLSVSQLREILESAAI